MSVFTFTYIFLSNAIKIHQNNKCLCVGFLDKTEPSHSNIVWNWFRWVEMRAIFYAGSLGLPLTWASVLLLFSSSFLQFSFIIHKILNGDGSYPYCSIYSAICLFLCFTPVSFTLNFKAPDLSFYMVLSRTCYSSLTFI